MAFYFLRRAGADEPLVLQTDTPLRRGEEILARTDRGVELVEVLHGRPKFTTLESSDRESRPHGEGHPIGAFSDGGLPRAEFLRRPNEQDRMLAARLNRDKRDAVEACREVLRENGSQAVLLDVTQSFDGETLVLEFLGSLDPQIEQLTPRIVERYESVVQTGAVARLLLQGCGPDCGTPSSGGCGGGCQSCSIAAACRQPVRDQETLSEGV